MRAHDDKFSIVELAGLEQNRIRNADFSHVVQKAAGNQGLHGTARDAHFLGNQRRNPGHPVVVGTSASRLAIARPDASIIEMCESSTSRALRSLSADRRTTTG